MIFAPYALGRNQCYPPLLLSPYSSASSFISCEEAGITILNEVGLDPGIDHMSAMKIIDDVHSRGGEITSFSSVCGGEIIDLCLFFLSDESSRCFQ